MPRAQGSLGQPEFMTALHHSTESVRLPTLTLFTNTLKVTVPFVHILLSENEFFNPSNLTTDLMVTVPDLERLLESKGRYELTKARQKISPYRILFSWKFFKISREGKTAIIL